MNTYTPTPDQAAQAAFDRHLDAEEAALREDLWAEEWAAGAAAELADDLARDDRGWDE